jgi:hypothetical protein
MRLFINIHCIYNHLRSSRKRSGFPSIGPQIATSIPEYNLNWEFSGGSLPRADIGAAPYSYPLGEIFLDLYEHLH